MKFASGCSLKRRQPARVGASVLALVVAAGATVACSQEEELSASRMRGRLQSTCAPYDGPAFNFEVFLQDGRRLRGMVTDPLPTEAAVAKSWVVGSTSKPHGLSGAVCPDGGERTACRDLMGGTFALSLREAGYLGKFTVVVQGGEEVSGAFLVDAGSMAVERGGVCG